jgi:hypothetical protein
VKKSANILLFVHEGEHPGHGKALLCEKLTGERVKELSHRASREFGN